jgi:hypothetical protein
MSCIFVKNHINALTLVEFCASDAAMVRIRVEEIARSLLLPQPTFHKNGDKPPPSKEIRGHRLLVLLQQEEATYSWM